MAYPGCSRLGSGVESCREASCKQRVPRSDPLLAEEGERSASPTPPRASPRARPAPASTSRNWLQLSRIALEMSKNSVENHLNGSGQRLPWHSSAGERRWPEVTLVAPLHGGLPAAARAARPPARCARTAPGEHPRVPPVAREAAEAGRGAQSAGSQPENPLLSTTAVLFLRRRPGPANPVRLGMFSALPPVHAELGEAKTAPYPNSPL